MAMRKKNCAGSTAAAEAAFDGALNSPFVSGGAAIHQNPRCAVTYQICVGDQRGNDRHAGGDFAHAPSSNVTGAYATIPKPTAVHFMRRLEPLDAGLAAGARLAGDPRLVRLRARTPAAHGRHSACKGD